jgi:hypothetical protein
VPIPGQTKGVVMLNVITFAIVAAALAVPLIVPIMWGAIENL